MSLEHFSEEKGPVALTEPTRADAYNSLVTVYLVNGQSYAYRSHLTTELLKATWQLTDIETPALATLPGADGIDADVLLNTAQISFVTFDELVQLDEGETYTGYDEENPTLGEIGREVLGNMGSFLKDTARNINAQRKDAAAEEEH